MAISAQVVLPVAMYGGFQHYQTYPAQLFCVGVIYWVKWIILGFIYQLYQIDQISSIYQFYQTTVLR